MEEKDCDHSKLKILRLLKTPSPMKMTPDLYDKESFHSGLVGLRAQLKDGSIIKSYGVNPNQYTDEKTGKTIYNCTSHFFVDFPQPLSPAEIANIDYFEIDAKTKKETFYKLPLPEKIILENFDPALPLQTLDYPSAAGEPYRIITLHNGASPEKAWDLVLLGDGFSAKELSLDSDEAVLNSTLGKAAKELSDYLFRFEPYKSLQDRINVKLVATVSKDSGIQKAKDKNKLNTFYSSVIGANCSDRLLIVRNTQRALDMGFLAHADSILVILNTNEYGGAGSFISTSTLNPARKTVFIHELGHALAGLSDGYSYSVRSIKSDTKNENTVMTECPDKMSGQVVASFSNINQYSLPEESLSANISHSVKAAQTKWQSKIPAVIPQFPVSISLTPFESSDTVRLTVRFEKIIRSKSYLTGFKSTNLNYELTDLIFINGEAANKFKKQTEKMMTLNGSDPFYYVEIPKPKDGIVELVFQAPLKYKNYFQYYDEPSNTNFMLLDQPIPPQQVQPVQMDTGHEFVYRSSLASVMSTSWPDIIFDTVEQDALRRSVCSYIEDRNAVATCK